MDPSAAERIEVRIAGDARRHGLVFAGVILAEAAVLFEGRFALQSQVFGSSREGRTGRSDVLLSGREIDSPKVSQLDALVCLTDEALLAYAGVLREGGLLITDDGLSARAGPRPVSLPLVPKEGSDPRVVGLAALGALCELRPLVGQGALEAALAARATGDELPRLREALERGRRLAQAAARS
ncbi:MAG: 2-oxoacid:acceptor oxidoreductase family protein [Deltaproteobacteria bacterium]